MYRRKIRLGLYHQPMVFLTLCLSYCLQMSIRCLFGLHRPMLNSIIQRADGLAALCDDCAIPMRRIEGSRWVASEPLVARRDH